MPDLIAIGQGLNAAKALMDIAKTIVGLRDSGKRLEATVEFNQQLFSVQKSLAGCAGGASDAGSNDTRP